MKTNFDAAKQLMELFGEKAFYSISVSEYNVTAQGKFNPSIVQRCKEDGYTCGFSDNGFINMAKDNILIILTQ